MLRTDSSETPAAALCVAQLFRHVRLVPCGPMPWGTPVPESRSGVYVVSLVRDPGAPCRFVDAGSLPDSESARWCAGQPVIYIGRTRRPLRCRLREFYRHTHGCNAPHRGGQAVLLLKRDLWVFWAATDQPNRAEREMIAFFVRHAGALPFANRRRERRPALTAAPRHPPHKTESASFGTKR